MTECDVCEEDFEPNDITVIEFLGLGRLFLCKGCYIDY